MIKKSAISLKTILITVLLLFNVLCVNATSGFPKETITKENATEDILFYFNLIDQQHGNPYEYISRKEFKALVDQKIAVLPSTISNKDLSSILIELNESIRCGHTIVKSNSGLIRRAIDRPDFFPYPISIIDNDIYLDFEDAAFPHASKILSIDGVGSKKILEELSELTITDGFIETKKKRTLESRFGYYLYLKYGAKTSFEVQYQTEEITSSVTVRGITGNKMLANHYYRPLYKSHERYYNFTHLDAVDSLRSLVLTLNTFQANPEWFYDKVLSRYNKVSKKFDFDNLVLDLRENEGGDRRLLNILYQIIAGKELFDPSETHVRSNSIFQTSQLLGINGSVNSEKVVAGAEAYLRKYFVNPEGDHMVGEVRNWYDEFKLDLNMDGATFEGQVYVLISGRTFSAAADLARILSPLPNVTLVGEETGGAHEARTANMLLSYELPHSAVNVQVPVIYEKFINTNADIQTGRGTFPDYFVKQTLEDLINKRDAVFEFTTDLIERNISRGSN